MTTQLRETDSTSLSLLAAEAFGDAGAFKSAEERGRLIGKMMRPLWGMAWRLTRPNHDLAEELRAHVLLRCEEGRYDPALGAFPAWVRTVMTRYLITLNDARKRAAGGSDDRPERIDARPPAERDEPPTPFSADDLDRIRKWRSPLKRVLLLSQSLLWRKYPADLWAADLAALGLSAPFPSADFEDMTRAERNAYLAERLGVPRNTIHVRMGRWERLLHDLQFVRDLSRGM